MDGVVAIYMVRVTFCCSSVLESDCFSSCKDVS